MRKTIALLAVVLCVLGFTVAAESQTGPAVVDGNAHPVRGSAPASPRGQQPHDHVQRDPRVSAACSSRLDTA